MESGELDPSNSEQRARRFLKHCAAALLVLASLTLGLTWAIDPLGVLYQHGGGRLCAPGIKSGLARESRFIAAVAYDPQEVLIGSSRVERGFDSITAERLLNGRAVNLSFGGARLNEVERTLKEIVTRTGVRRAWVSLEFGAFTREPLQERSLTFPRRLPMPIFAWREGLFSPVALRITLISVLVPSRCRLPPLDRHGFVKIADTREWQAGDGMLEHLTRAWVAHSEKRDVRYVVRLQQLRRLTRWLRSREVEPILFLSPMSATYRRTLADAGLTETYRRWREDIRVLARESDLTLIEADSEAFLDSVRGRCPAEMTRDQCLFFDPLHFRPEVGAAILAAGPTLDRTSAPSS